MIRRDCGKNWCLYVFIGVFIRVFIGCAEVFIGLHMSSYFSHYRIYISSIIDTLPSSVV